MWQPWQIGTRCVLCARLMQGSRHVPCWCYLAHRASSLARLLCRRSSEVQVHDHRVSVLQLRHIAVLVELHVEPKRRRETCHHSSIELECRNHGCSQSIKSLLACSKLDLCGFGLDLLRMSKSHPTPTHTIINQASESVSSRLVQSKPSPSRSSQRQRQQRKRERERERGAYESSLQGRELFVSRRELVLMRHDGREL